MHHETKNRISVAPDRIPEWVERSVGSRASIAADWRRAIIRVSELSQTQKMICVAIADHMDRTGVSFPSVARIARYASVSDRTVRRELSKIEAAGWLTIARPETKDALGRPKYGHGSHSRYHATFASADTASEGTDTVSVEVVGAERPLTTIEGLTSFGLRNSGKLTNRDDSWADAPVVAVHPIAGTTVEGRQPRDVTDASSVKAPLSESEIAAAGRTWGVAGAGAVAFAWDRRKKQRLEVEFQRAKAEGWVDDHQRWRGRVEEVAREFEEAIRHSPWAANGLSQIEGSQR
jgi:hypothetical protein